jgi:hypothetical protein
MNAVALTSNARPIAASGLAAWAMRTGRALERWGRERALRRHDRERMLARRAAAAEASQAIAERDAAHRRSTTFGLM